MLRLGDFKLSPRLRFLELPSLLLRAGEVAAGGDADGSADPSAPSPFVVVVVPRFPRAMDSIVKVVRFADDSEQ